MQGLKRKTRASGLRQGRKLNLAALRLNFTLHLTYPPVSHYHTTQRLTAKITFFTP
jgi:hypothetical protein